VDIDTQEKSIQDLDYLKFSPKVEGKVVWLGRRMLHFIPESLEPDTRYRVSLDMKKLFNDYKAKPAVLNFEFSTVAIHLSVEFDDLTAVSNEAYSLIGIIRSNTPIRATEFSNLLKTQFEGKDKPQIDYKKLDNQNIEFTISAIKRGNTSEILTIYWDGTSIGSESQGQAGFEIPAKDDFRFLSYRVKAVTASTTSLVFSDPLRRTQDLRGIIQIENSTENPRIIIRNNIVDLEFTRLLSGNIEITVGKDLVNSENKKLGKDLKTMIHIIPPPPALKLVDDGIIIPGDGNIKFSFEAINLKAVDIEIRKIYGNNIMQFLHYNSFSSEYIPDEISDIVFQNKVDLHKPGENIDMTQWRTYSLDLSQFIKADKGAIYNVKAGFRKLYTDYPCSDGNEAAFNETGLDMVPEFDKENPTSIWKDWYWYEGYRWDHRNDPCYPMYYTAGNFIQKNMLASKIGLTVKSAKNNSLMVIATDLLTARPLSNVSISCYTYSQQLMDEKKTDSNGLAVFSFSDKKPYFVFARYDKDFGYLDLNEGRSLSVSEFDVAGKRISKGIDGFIYGERGVWRPGDSLFLNFVLRQVASELPSDHPVHFELIDPQGKSYLKMVNNKPVGSIYKFNCKTNSNAPTGNWLAKVRVGNKEFTERIKIETVKPNRLKINVEFRSADKLSLDEQATIDVKYLTGLVPSGSSAAIDLYLRKIKTTFKSYESYTFDDPASSFSSSEIRVFDGPLDNQGNATFKLNLDKRLAYPGLLSGTFSVKAFEKSGEFSSDNFSRIISPYSEYVGMRFPAGRWGDKSVKSGENVKIPVIVLNKDGKPVANRKITAMLYNAQWRWWWDNSGSQIANYISDMSITPFISINAVTDSKGVAEISFKLEDSGAYLLRASSSGSGHSSGVLFYSGYFGGGADQTRDFASKLKFELDKKEYKPGEKAKLTIPAGKGSMVFIAIEDSESIRTTSWHTSSSDVFTYDIPIEKWMFPNTYLHVAVFNPMGNRISDVPVRRYGITPVKVLDPARQLNPVINAPDVIKPSSEYEIRVSEKNKKAMAYTLAVVDDGLLDLTRFRTPDPHDHFFSKFASSVLTWDIYNHLINNEPLFGDKILSIGGSDHDDVVDGKKASRFIPVVTSLGPFYLEKGKTAKHKLKMDNYSGSVRVMVVAVGDKDYGNSEKTIPVKTDLMLLLTAPRVLSPSEDFELPVTVFSTNPAIKNVNITLVNNDLFDLTGTNNTSIRFDKQGEAIAYLKLKTGNREGIGKLEVRASAGNFTADQKIEIQIENPNPYIRQINGHVINSGQQAAIRSDRIGVPGTNSAIIELSNLPKLELESKISGLLHYPYGCIEQTTSTAFPLLSLRNIMEMPPERADKINNIILATISKLKRFQIGNGGMSYWPGRTDVDTWGTVYAMHFLLEAGKYGYNTSPILENGIKYLENAVRGMKNTGNTHEMTQRSYALMVLSRAGKPNRSAMNFMFNRDDMPALARWYLALAYNYSGNSDVAGKLYARGNNEIADYNDVYYTYGSALRDNSVQLMLLQALKKTNEATRLAKEIIEKFNAGWSNTQETAYVLIALSDYIGQTGQGIDCNVMVGGKTIAVKSQKSLFALSLQDAEMGEMKITNSNSRSPLYVNIISSGKAPQEEGSAESSNLNMSIEYLDAAGNRIDISSLKMGTEFKAVVTVRGTNSIKDYRNMALNQVFPSGWEILNWRMTGAENAAVNVTYQDIRDDRVYSFFNLRREGIRIEIPLIASYPGRYYLPVQFAESMYDNSIYNRQIARWVEVIR
jgi:uncharacterized protein YfaS (alpha-2-macroglobulin family)